MLRRVPWLCLGSGARCAGGVSHCLGGAGVQRPQVVAGWRPDVFVLETPGEFIALLQVLSFQTEAVRSAGCRIEVMF